jgi:hypothetical protein
LYTDHFAVEAVDIHQKVKCQGSMGKGKARPRGYHTSKQVIKLIDDEIDHTLAVCASGIIWVVYARQATRCTHPWSTQQLEN